MKTAYRTVVGGIVFVAALMGSSAGAATIYSNGFETNTTDWSGVTRVPSGTGGIPSAAGSFHATTTSGSFTQWGGYNYGAGNAVPTVFQEYTTSVGIYLNVGGGFINDRRFDFTSAINNSAGVHRRDFAYNVGFYNAADVTGPGAGTDRFVISTGNNTGRANSFPKNTGSIAIATTGWYSFTNHFYDNGGVLAVDFQIFDASNSLVGSWTNSNPADLISLIGGNRYGWFPNNEFGANVLAIDNASLAVAPLPGVLGLGLSMMGGVGAMFAVRKRMGRKAVAV